MKRLLLAGTAIVGAAILASPAQADLKIDLGGHFRGYGVFADNDDSTSRVIVNGAGTATTTITTGASLRGFEFKRDMEVHFSGETTTDSGLTVGVHAELDLGNESANASTANPYGTPGAFYPLGDPNQLDEAYIYFSGAWGRVNFGSEDGAAYLLQVAAPSADSNVDGMRVYVTGLNSDVWDNGLADGSMFGGLQNVTMNYGNDYFGGQYGAPTDRFTYLTPKWNGFQAGLSYAPEAGQGKVNDAIGGMSVDNDPIDYEDLWEVAARWDGEFEGFGISLGAGYSTASNELSVVGSTLALGSDDITTWDAGATVSWNDFSLGVAYTKYTDTGVAGGVVGAADSEIETWVVGAAWDNGPYHLGASYLNSDFDANAFGLGGGFGIGGTAGDGYDIDRITVGGGYTYGPGMTFRGAVAFGSVDADIQPTGPLGFNFGANTDFAQVTIGTDVNF